jgi:mono/diheme cytochrome c family protein
MPGPCSRSAAAAVAVALGLTLGVAGCGGDETKTTTLPTGTIAGGDIASGRNVFLSNGCGDCHTLEAAGTIGTTGPNLDQELRPAAEIAGGPFEEYVRTSIVSPGSFVMPQYSDGVMPSDYESRLSKSEIDDLVAFIVSSVPEPETDGG